MRKFGFLATVFAFFFVVNLASAQQADIFVGGGTLLSSSPNTDTLQQVDAEKGGLYLNLGGDVIFKHHLGFNIEGAWRAKQALDFIGQPYRPILFDFNGIFQPRLSKRIGADLMGGIGFQSTRYYGYVPTISCEDFNACYTSTNHFLVHVGGGIRYYPWGHMFIRPEVHYYKIFNNFEFSSDNVIRVGASIGYTIGGPE